MRLEPVGIDPYNDARAIPLQLDAERYRRMTAYFESIGPYGIRMMRQTAALQLSVDRGGEPAARRDLPEHMAALQPHAISTIDIPAANRRRAGDC